MLGLNDLNPKSSMQPGSVKVTTLSNSIEALATFQDQPNTFDLIITDLTMPGMTGVDLSRRILQIRPDILRQHCPTSTEIKANRQEDRNERSISGFC
jgi:CheY-like chemotaxis protein